MVYRSRQGALWHSYDSLSVLNYYFSWKFLASCMPEPVKGFGRRPFGWKREGNKNSSSFKTAKTVTMSLRSGTKPKVRLNSYIKCYYNQNQSINTFSLIKNQFALNPFFNFRGGSSNPMASGFVMMFPSLFNCKLCFFIYLFISRVLEIIPKISSQAF